MPQLNFHLPDDSKLIVSIVQAIPNHWRSVEGALYAPIESIQDGSALANTDLHLDCELSHISVIQGDVFALMVERKRPGRVVLDVVCPESESNKSSRLRPLNAIIEAKRIANGFIELGYRGSIVFYSACNLIPATAIMNMSLSLTGGHQVHTPQVSLIWDPKFDGREEHIAPIAQVCRRFIPPERPEVTTCG